MKNVFKFAEACLLKTAIDKKLALTIRPLAHIRSGELSLISDQPVLPIGQ